MSFSKTDFLHYLNCPKSLWLLKQKPTIYPHGPYSKYLQKIIDEGYEVETYAEQLFSTFTGSEDFKFQVAFKSVEGLYAKVDCLKANTDGTFNLYEVKSSTNIKRNPTHNHVKDATFQKIVVERAGFRVDQVNLVHLNGNYVRGEQIKPCDLMIVEDITDEVEGAFNETNLQINDALDFLQETEIDESFCSCLYKTKTHHCDTFKYFNANIPNVSVFDLPRISNTKLKKFAAERRFDLDEIAVGEVTAKQSLVLQAAHARSPIVNYQAISNWFSKVQYPLYFIDYETYASAVPIIPGAKPHFPIVFQYSLHVKEDPHSTSIMHFEYLSEKAEMPLSLIEKLRKHIGEDGTIVSWHASFENSQNRNMAEMYDDHRDFLYGMINRTVDLEDIFKDAYVDIEFKGSTSIKKVLPVLIPELSYDGMQVANGTDAMEAWIRMINLPPGEDKQKLKQTMLSYCELDTLAMVRIFECMERKLADIC